MNMNEMIAELINARQAEKAAKERVKTASAWILDQAAGAAFLETDDFRVMIVDRSRVDLDQAAVMDILTDLKKEFPKLVTWKEIKPQEKTEAEKAAALATA